VPACRQRARHANAIDTQRLAEMDSQLQGVGGQRVVTEPRCAQRCLLLLVNFPLDRLVSGCYTEQLTLNSRLASVPTTFDFAAQVFEWTKNSSPLNSSS
jgi:hypothetical protein